MLLPSDVARLVLGYLQEEGLSATSQAFIHESPNLKEYADHTIGDGAVPACVFSVFGKGLTTILNEYIAARSKEACHEVPAVMTSLWKKLDFTLKQIKSLQNSSATPACQRARSRAGVANLARQRVLTVASAGSVICSPVSETGSYISPAHSSHSMLGHSTPVNYTGPHIRAAPGTSTHQQIYEGSRSLNMQRDSSVQIVVSEHRVNLGPISPARRKWDTPRKRSSALSGSSGTGRSTMIVGNHSAEPQPEEVVDENFPQLMIQNARDKILGDRSLQEKLAENINKILASEPIPQTSKAPSSALEADQSIDEILGLQGEIHMSDDAIHDILEQTESDPAFQALFELFDCNKTRLTDGEPGIGDICGSQEESDIAGPSSAVRHPQGVDLGATHRDGNASDTPTTVNMRAVQERRTRKMTAPTLLRKTILGSSGRASRIENSSARLLVNQGEHRGVSSAAMGSNRNEKVSLFSNSVGATPMDIDELLITHSLTSDSAAPQELLEPVAKDNFSCLTALSDSTTVPLSSATAEELYTEAASSSGTQKEDKPSKGSKERPATATSAALSNQLAVLSPRQVELTAVVPHMSVSSNGGETQPVSSLSVSPEPTISTFASTDTTAAAAVASASNAAPNVAIPGSLTSFSTSVTHTSTPGSSTSASPLSSALCAPITVVPVSANNSPSKTAADTGNIVSLKIIISDNQDEDSSSGTALNQAISGVSVPTIYLSSPAKSQGGPGTPRANLDETALAVSGLQSSEMQASPLRGKIGAVVASPLTGTSQDQQSYIIQLPVDTTNTGLQGTSASYFLVTEPSTADAEARQVLLPTGVSMGQSLPTSSQFIVTTAAHSQGFAAGSALILPSPAKPMMLPVSVMGPNALGKVRMVSNQLVAVPNPMPIQQSETVKLKPATGAVIQSTTGGTAQTLVGKVVQPFPAGSTSQQNVPKDLIPPHRRILCFESSAEVQPPTSKTRITIPTAINTSTSNCVIHTEKDDLQTVPRTKPVILSANKPKRRVQTIRCSADPQSGVRLLKQTEKSIPPQEQHKNGKRNSRKQDLNIRNQESSTASTNQVDAPQPESLKNLKSGKRSKSTGRKHIDDKGNDEAQAQDSHSSGSRKDKDESNRKEAADKGPTKSREITNTEKKPPQEIPNVTANKENEIKGSVQEQQQSTPSSSAPGDVSPAAVTLPVSTSQSKPGNAPSKTSSLAKQATEMLHDIQGLNSPKLVKRPEVSGSDLTVPRTPGTDRNREEQVDFPRTPSRQRKGKDGEGTPKHIIFPNTPDIPTCSPASEAGSENSINMAAHTLMILSRAAIARTGTPLKDSLRQHGEREKSSTSSKNAKKRKHTSPTTSPPAKESKQSSGKKKDREKKKLMNCFPHDLDVDKFLSSLHYDE